MPVTSLLSSDAQELTIFIEGAFDFKAHHDFRNAYESQGPEQRYIVDLGAVHFLDSSALGMLLSMHESAWSIAAAMCARS